MEINILNKCFVFLNYLDFMNRKVSFIDGIKFVFFGIIDNSFNSVCSFY